MSKKMSTWLPGQENLKALFDAYVEESGIPLTASFQRKVVLREIASRECNLTPDDVRVVIRGIKRHIERGSQGYTDASLDWRNAMANVDTLEERALKARQAKARKAKPEQIVAHTTTMMPGDAVTRLAPQEPTTSVPTIDVKRALRDLANKIGGTAR